MKTRVSLASVIILGFSACAQNTQPGSPATASGNPTAASQAAHQAAGVKWQVPSRWTTVPPRPMRVATYRIPAAPGDSEDAECAAYFFGPGQGGTVAANLTRWASQFQLPDFKPARAQQSERTIAGLKVHTMSVSGTYLAVAGPMSPVEEKKPGYSMLGAIVEAPEGLVFFKLTGSAKTVARALPEFNALLESLKPC